MLLVRTLQLQPGPRQQQVVKVTHVLRDLHLSAVRVLSAIPRPSCSKKRSRIASETKGGFAASSHATFFRGFPSEPADPLLTVEDAIVTKGGKLDTTEYLHLRDHFAKERPPTQHPVPSKPGVRKEEEEQDK